MYSIDDFEKLIKSDLTTEEVCNKVLELNPIHTKQKYSDDDEKPFAVYVGGVGEDDYVTVNDWIHPLSMKFDDKTVYVDFVNLIRDTLKNGEEDFEKAVIASVRKTSRRWFREIKDENSKENSLLASMCLERYKDPGRQRDTYAAAVGYDSEELCRTIYEISKFKGAGDIAKCVEINSVACNLLAFSGYESALVQGYFTNIEGNIGGHTFPIYKNSEGNYDLLDCMLKQQHSNVLPGDVDFEKGFEFECHIKEGLIAYKCEPQRIIEKSQHIK